MAPRLAPRWSFSGVVTLFLDGSKALLKRMNSPMKAFIGSNGSGKSLLAVDEARMHLLAGTRVRGTVRLLDPDRLDEMCDDDECTFGMHPHHAPAHPLWSPITAWEHIVDAEDCHILLDEVSSVMSARESSNLPSIVSEKIQQLRRAGVSMSFTAPAWARADLCLREVVQVAVMCRGWVSKPVPGQMWRTWQYVSSQGVDARELDELTQSMRLGTSRNKIRTLVRGVQRIDRTPGRFWYETHDSISSLNVRHKKGACVMCGGSVRVPACSCSH